MASAHADPVLATATLWNAVPYWASVIVLLPATGPGSGALVHPLPASDFRAYASSQNEADAAADDPHPVASRLSRVTPRPRLVRGYASGDQEPTVRAVALPVCDWPVLDWLFAGILRCWEWRRCSHGTAGRLAGRDIAEDARRRPGRTRNGSSGSTIGPPWEAGTIIIAATSASHSYCKSDEIDVPAVALGVLRPAISHPVCLPSETATR